MNEVEGEVGEFVLEILKICCSQENRAKLEDAAEERKLSFEQLVAAATARKLSEEFVIRRKLGAERFSAGHQSRRTR